MKKLLVAFVIVLILFIASVASAQRGDRGLREEGRLGGQGRGQRMGMTNREVTPEMKKQFGDRRAETVKKPEEVKKGNYRKFVEVKREVFKRGEKPQLRQRTQNNRGQIIDRVHQVKSRGGQGHMRGQRQGQRGRGNEINFERSEQGKERMIGRRGSQSRPQVANQDSSPKGRISRRGK